uniref:disease resistance protein RPV1-like n=1 Tax=Erigeron canadensis TaxID=72917 RepID=UPI001CB8F9BD|nr:disease resistance protein RPV1-like [Erigeron canadensis]
MASASSSSVEKSYIYDVFISFRGKDLRTSFVDHLYHALRKSGIIVFKDDKDIKVGERISDKLPKAIRDSKFHIVIFSERYADSYWCLNELVEILEICQDPKEERTLYPIFYHVKPSEVRDLKGQVGEAFSVHLENEAAGRWRAAMAQAASLEGWELTKTGDGHEVQFIEKIVHAISQKPYFANFNVNDNLVGMTTRVEKLLLSLQVGFDDVRMIGITGLGGVGKTTLAGVIFNRIANQFDGKSFVQNVRERSEDSKGLQDMQKQILTSVYGDQSIDVPSDFEGRSMMQRRMPSIKVVVVLDDVNNGKQLEALAEPSWFRPGSRIIITSRDRQVLVAHGVESHSIHDVSTLSDEDAIRLLSRYAFKTECPAQGYEELSEKVVRYAAGLPLTIKTLSSSLRDCPTDAWEDAIKRLETIPWGDTLKILKISYDALEEDQKDIFLHVACLLKGEKKKRAIIILESLGYRAKIGLGVLEKKSLITFCDGHKYYDRNDAYDDDNDKRLLDMHDDDNDKRLLDMHDHVEEMGMHIVRSLYPDEPERHKLLWINHEIETIVDKDLGTESIRGIKLQHTNLRPAKLSRSLKKMRRLCFLHVVWLSKIDEFVEAGKYLPSSLQFLHWYRYPYRYLPNTFQGDRLVVMEMPYSHIHQLWKGGKKKVLPKLRLLDLGYSKIETLNSGGMLPNLEELVLRQCKKLVEVNISDECSHLKKLDLYECTALEKLTISNECLSPLKSLNVSFTKLRRLNLGLTPNLEVLSVKFCYGLEELVMPVEYRMLTKLSLHYIGNLHSLNLVLPLTKLSLHSIYGLRSLNLGLTPNLKVLSVEECKDLEELVMPVECRMLTKFSLFGIDKLRRLNLGMTPNLEVLSVERCDVLEELVMLVECPMLTKLSVSHTNLRSLNLGITPNLEVLSVEECEALEELVMPVDYCKDLEELDMPVECTMLTELTLSGNKELRSFNLGLTPNLEVLSLSSCQKIFVPVELPRLRVLSVIDDYEDEHHYGSFSYLLEKFKSSTLSFPNMNHLRVDDSIYMLKHHLRVLDLQWCLNLKQLPEDLDRLECLEELSLSLSGSLRNIPDCVCNMTRLRVLDLGWCENLKQLPEDLDRLECLEELLLFNCSSLENIPDCICNMTRLKTLDLSYCDKLEKLPDEFRRLQSLELLDVTWGTADRLKNLPESISQLKNLELLNSYESRVESKSSGNVATRWITRLKTLDLSYCDKLEKLPDEFRRLQSLELLDVLGIADRLKNLPESISQLKHLKVRNSWAVLIGSLHVRPWKCRRSLPIDTMRPCVCVFNISPPVEDGDARGSWNWVGQSGQMRIWRLQRYSVLDRPLDGQ